MQPIKFYTTHTGPNPLKVALIFGLLEIPYEEELIPHRDLKGPEYTAVNPNGRLPALYDPNTDLTLWECAAMIEYICDKYDKQYKLSFPSGSAEYYHARQWLYFQASGQGPYYGQASWFRRFHSEKLPSAEQRYIDELEKRCLMLILRSFPGKELWKSGLPMKGLEGANMPHYKDWMSRMLAVPEVKEVLRVADEKAAVAWPKFMASLESQKT